MRRITKMSIVKFILAPLIGGFLGFLYYKFIGCSSGACPITSNPWASTIYGVIIGIAIAFL